MIKLHSRRRGLIISENYSIVLKVDWVKIVYINIKSNLHFIRDFESGLFSTRQQTVSYPPAGLRTPGARILVSLQISFTRMCIVTSVLTQHATMRQTFNTQHFSIPIRKSTCVGCTKQSKSSFTLKNIQKEFTLSHNG